MRRQTALWTVVTLFVGAAVLLGVMVALGALDVHVLSHSRIGSEDRTIDNNFAHHRDAFWNSVTKVLTYGAETLPVIVASVVLCVIAAVVFRRWHEPVFVASTLIGEVAVFVLTTLLVHRARPTVPQLDHAPPTSSFPSGHTAAADLPVRSDRSSRRRLRRASWVADTRRRDCRPGSGGGSTLADVPRDALSDRRPRRVDPRCQLAVLHLPGTAHDSRERRGGVGCPSGSSGSCARRERSRLTVAQRH